MESIAFQRLHGGGRAGHAVVACVSASEGSWNLIIVNHTGLSRGSDKPFAGSIGGPVPVGTPLCAWALPTALPTPTRWGSGMSYRQCHSFTITNTGQKQQPANDVQGGWQAATTPQTLQPQTTPDHWGHHNSLVSSHPVLKNNSWLTSNIA